MNGTVPQRPAREARGWLSRQRALALVLIAATAIAFYLCYRLVEPFLPAMAWALALAVLARPLHVRLAAAIASPAAAAAITVVLVALILLLPALFVGHHLTNEATAAAAYFQDDATLAGWNESLEQFPRLQQLLAWAGDNLDVRGEIARTASTVTASLPAVLRGSFWLVLQWLVTLFLLFYLLRDRLWALGALRSLVPLSDAETSDVFRRVADTIHATIFGTLSVAVVQGTLGGLMFWLLGLPTPLLWGVVMTLLATVPTLSTLFVWLPASVILAVQGHWGKALILAGWGAVVIGLIDNLLYPMVVGNRMRLHTVPVFFAILGGLALFGAAGIILGPLVLAVTDALIDVWRRRTAHGQTAEAGVKDSRGTEVAIAS